MLKKARQYWMSPEKNGVYIPSLCYHAKIGALGRCRACVVEIGGAAGLHTACSTLAAGRRHDCRNQFQAGIGIAEAGCRFLVSRRVSIIAPTAPGMRIAS